jgi:hypothetical protein
MFTCACWLQTTSKDASAKGEVERVGVDDGDAVAEAGVLVQPFGDCAVLGGQIDGCPRSRSCARAVVRVPDAGADVEDAVVRGDPGEVGEARVADRPRRWNSSSGARSSSERRSGFLPAARNAFSILLRRSPRLYWASTARATVMMSFSFGWGC